MDSKNKRQRMTLLLDNETIKALKDYGYKTFGETNVSKAVMSMVKDYEQRIKTIHTTQWL